jgi:hypothetical protein
MTTNVPQDVIDSIEIAAKEADWERFDSAIAQLRAQRQQGAEPDGYFYEEISGTKGHFFGDISDNTKWQVEHNDMKLTPFWLTARPTLDFAAGMMKAAEICENYAGIMSLAEYRAIGHHCVSSIKAAIPKESADAEAALREVCMRVAKKSAPYHPNLDYLNKQLEQIVNSVLGEGGK